MTERVATTHSAKTATVASTETAVGRAIATRTATAEILLHADPETDQGRQRDDPEAQVASNGKESAVTTIEIATFADGRRNDAGIATVVGIAITAGMTVTGIALGGTGHGMVTEIRGERGRRRRKIGPSLLLRREEVRR